MSGKTTIEWTAMPGFAPAVWNPTTGCTRVSAGCDNCYAFALHDKRYKGQLDFARLHVSTNEILEKRLYDLSWMDVAELLPFKGPEWIVEARRLGYKMPLPKQYDLPFSRVQLLEERLDVPLRTKKPTCYFVDSMADLFHEDVPDEFIQRVWVTMLEARQHRFLILTKRPERMRDWVSTAMTHVVASAPRTGNPIDMPALPLPNVWLGTSVEDQRAADERIPHLLATPAAVRFLSCEPLLGPLELQGALNIYGHTGQPCHVKTKGWHKLAGDGLADIDQSKHPRVDWVIVGGESGPRARPMDLAWATSLRDQCAVAGVSFFMKQLGSKPVDSAPHGMWASVRPWVKLAEAHGRDVDEWPEDLRIRTWPR